MVTLEHHDWAVQFGHVQTQVVRSDLFISRVGENLPRFHGLKVSAEEQVPLFLPSSEWRYLVASHAVAVENTHFLVLLSGHVVKALVGLHITNLRVNRRESQRF